MGFALKIEFTAPQRIIFGNGALSQVGEIGQHFGCKPLVVTGGGSVALESLFQILEDSDLVPEVFRVHHEPDIATIEMGSLQGKSKSCDFVIGIGGGSVIDSAKAISAMITNRGEVLDYLEVIGKAQQITKKPLPVIAIPTTAGTGAEVTKNAVVSSDQHHVKVSMRSGMMIPKVALVDPELTYSMPPSVTASTGMDALVQCLEPYVSNKRNPLTDAFAEKGIKLGARSLLVAYQDGLDKTAREGMALTSLFGGLALANSGLGAVHGFAGVIGGMYDAPHGVICARLLAPVMRYNIRALTQAAGKEDLLDRYLHIAQWLTGRADTSIKEGLNWVDELTEMLSIPRLRAIGVKPSDFEQIISKTSVSSSNKKNPIQLETDDLRKILSESY